MNRFTIRMSAALAVLAFAAIAFSPIDTAQACGGGYSSVPPDFARVHGVVSEHFMALNRHDLRGLLSQWTAEASVQSVRYTKDGPAIVSEKIERAAKRWIASKHPTEFAIRSLDVEGNVATAHLDVLWGGLSFDDVLVLTRASDGAWKIAGKTSRRSDKVSGASLASFRGYY